jgi:Uma2 family endonuclease
MASTTFTKKGPLFTYSDLEDLSDDENRYELSSGTLIVTPAPNTRHQALAASLAAFLHVRKLSSQRVLVEAELFIRADMVKRPDIQVVSENLVGGQSVEGVPDLVIEIHSPSTKVLDLTEKRFIYAEAHIRAYWVIDPDALTLTILELKDDAYEEVAVVDALSSHDVTIPFAMTIEGPLIFE